MHLFLLTTTICLLLPALVITAAVLLQIRSLSDRENSSPFECGFDPNNSARIPFSTRFFLLAVIFLVFDIEIALLSPLPYWLISFNLKFPLLGFLIFLLILILGLFHEWREGSLDWTE